MRPRPTFPKAWHRATRRALALDPQGPFLIGEDKAGVWTSTRFVAVAGVPAGERMTHVTRTLVLLKKRMRRGKNVVRVGKAGRDADGTPIQKVGPIWVQEPTVWLLRLCDELRVATTASKFRIVVGYRGGHMVAAVAEFAARLEGR